MKKLSLNQLSTTSAAVAAALQAPDGSMPPGHNGPYRDPETPVRDTSHWLITFLHSYKVSGDKCFLEAAQRGVDYLKSEEARPMGATFWHRRNPEKDSCNGLVGQAWTIEALAVAAKALGDDACQRLAEEVFLLHPFGEAAGLWRRVGADGSYLSVDPTFNHQLWFAAAGALLLPSNDARVARRVLRFMDALPKNLALYPSGLIRHPLMRALGRRARVRCFVRDLRYRALARSERFSLFGKAIGYHAFNLYAFALLRGQLPRHTFWHSTEMRQALSYVEKPEFSAGLEGNRYGYPYNPAGFEVAFALGAFGSDVQAEQEFWASKQVHRSYDFDANLMQLGTEDPVTLAARLYESTRLPDLPVRLED